MEKTSLKKTFFLVTLIALLAEIGVFLYLNKHHVDVKLGLGTAQSICNVSETLNCDTAAASNYAELFGIPMALLGAFTNGLILMFLLLARFNISNDTEKTERLTFYLSTFTLLVSAVMAGISAFVLKSGCPFCIASYALALLIWGGVLLSFKPDIRRFGEDLRDLFTTEKWVLGTLISIPVLSLLVSNMTLDSYGYQEIKRKSQSSLSQWQNAPERSFDLENGLQYQNGSGEAKVVIVEFADFLCPHCKTAYPNLHSFAKSHPDVKLVFKNFPLDGACNPAIEHKGDGKRCDYSYATFCADKLAKKGWEAHNYFFDNQESLFTGNVDQILAKFCEASGVDCAELKTCMGSEEIHERVKKMANEGAAAQISGTPAIFFNNRVLSGGQLIPVLENIYKSLSK